MNFWNENTMTEEGKTNLSIAKVSPMMSNLQYRQSEENEPEVKNEVTDPILSILQKQSAQLQTLQSQVKRLLACQSAESPLNSSNSLNVSDNCTQTSSPGSPRRPASPFLNGIRVIRNCIPDEHAVRSFAVTSFNDDENPVITEPSSLYEVEDEQPKKFDKILNQVQRLLSPTKGESMKQSAVSTDSFLRWEKKFTQESMLVPKEEPFESSLKRLPSIHAQDINKESLNKFSLVSNESDQEELSHHKKPDDSLEATIQRIRQIGVSFINKEDLIVSIPESKNTTALPIDTFYQPKVINHIEHLDDEVVRSTDVSLILNKAAKKYLNDSDRPLDNNEGHYGLPDTHLSLATKEFLKQHKLVENELNEMLPTTSREPRSEPILHNISAILKQPKLL